MENRLKLILVLLLFLAFGRTVKAQRFTLSTNILEYANLGTLNLDASFGVAQKWSVVAGVRYNPFSFESSRKWSRRRLQQTPAQWKGPGSFYVWLQKTYTNEIIRSSGSTNILLPSSRVSPQVGQENTLYKAPPVHSPAPNSRLRCGCSI